MMTCTDAPTPPAARHTRAMHVLLAASMAMSLAHAQPAADSPMPAATPPVTATTTEATARTLSAWLQRWQHAAATQSFSATITSTGSAHAPRRMRIWHTVHNGQPLERIDAQGATPPHTLYRSGDRVSMVMPHKRQVRVRTLREHALPLLAGMAAFDAARQADIARHYRLHALPAETVAGRIADVLAFVPVDALRHAYRFWSDADTGLLLKWQMLHWPPTGHPPSLAAARVIREVALADVRTPSPIGYEQLQDMQRHATQGLAVKQRHLQTLHLAAQGWHWKPPAPGGYAVHACYARPAGGGKRIPPDGDAPPPPPPPLHHHPQAMRAPAAASPHAQPHAPPAIQCILSDGLSGISLFIDPASHTPPAALLPLERARGDLHAISRTIGAYRVTAMGETPAEALRLVLGSLYRR